MKKTFSAIVLFALLAGFVSPYKFTANKIQSFNWLIGSWKMNTKRGTIHEKWNAFNDSTLSGESSIKRSTGETVLQEKLELAFRGKDYFYIPTTQGQNNRLPVLFRITSYSEKGFVAENPEHDFPKRIIYNRVNSDSIHAYIDGGTDQPDKRADFYYSRIKN
jgi:hypothetical protein